ncbi:MAG: hypothetical protein JW854_11795 [Actinobacteria bacterium]|nr:hypothetical protein [Actinomycetota bacterium]
MKTCSVCGAPKKLTGNHKWLSGGTIVEKNNPSHRMIFVENDNILEVFKLIQEILGLSLEKVVIESQRKATYDYVNSILPAVIRKIVRFTSYRPVVRNLTMLGKTYGLGDVSLLDMHIKGGEGDYVKLGIRNPFFLPAFCGMVAGAMEVVTGHDCSVSYQEKSPGYYEVTTFVSTHPKEFVERLHWREYGNKPGDAVLDECPGCGGPSILADYDFDIEAGTISRRASGRRMVIDGPAEFEAILDELERELGEDISQILIEAQRRFVKMGFYDTDEVQDVGTFRDHLALRGFGNLKEISFAGGRLSVHLENPCLHLLLVGLVLGFFELVFKREGRVDWELADGGDLRVEVE